MDTQTQLAIMTTARKLYEKDGGAILRFTTPDGKICYAEAVSRAHQEHIGLGYPDKTVEAIFGQPMAYLCEVNNAVSKANPKWDDTFVASYGTPEDVAPTRAHVLAHMDAKIAELQARAKKEAAQA